MTNGDLSSVSDSEPVSRCKEISLDQCRLISLPKIEDVRGNLTFIQSGIEVEFDFKRVYYVYDVPGGAERGGHAHLELRQLLIAVSGSFDVHIDDGRERKSFHLNRSYTGLYIAPMVWREIDNFSGASVCLVLASHYFDEADYIRDYAEFAKMASNP